MVVSSKWYTFGTYPCYTTDKKKVLTYHSNATWVSPHKLTWESERQHREVNSLSDHPYGSADCDEQLTWRKSLTHTQLTDRWRTLQKSVTYDRDHLPASVTRCGPVPFSRKCVSSVTKNCGNLLQKWRILFVFMTATMLVSYILFE